MYLVYCLVPTTIIMLFTSATTKLLSRVVHGSSHSRSLVRSLGGGYRCMSSSSTASTFDLTGAFKVGHTICERVPCACSVHDSGKGTVTPSCSSSYQHYFCPFTMTSPPILDVDSFVGNGAFRKCGMYQGRFDQNV